MDTNIALVKGVKARTKAVATFLERNDIDSELFYGRSLGPMYVKQLDNFFRTKGVEGDIKIFFPHYEGAYASPICFLCFDWILVKTAREVTDALIKPIPNGWAELCQEIGVEAKPSVFIVGNYSPGFKSIEKLAVGNDLLDEAFQLEPPESSGGW